MRVKFPLLPLPLVPLVGAMLLASGPVLAADAAQVDPAIPDYTKSSGVSGNLSSVGSDTLANLMTLWAEEFKREYPNVNIQIQAAGSSTAPPALTEGASNLGPMSRKMKDKEAMRSSPPPASAAVPKTSPSGASSA